MIEVFGRRKTRENVTLYLNVLGINIYFGKDYRAMIYTTSEQLNWHFNVNVRLFVSEEYVVWSEFKVILKENWRLLSNCIFKSDSYAFAVAVV